MKTIHPKKKGFLLKTIPPTKKIDVHKTSLFHNFPKEVTETFNPWAGQLTPILKVSICGKWLQYGPLCVVPWEAKKSDWMYMERILVADLSVDRGEYDYTGWLVVDVGFLGQFDRLVTKQKQHSSQLVTSFPGNRKGFFFSRMQIHCMEGWKWVGSLYNSGHFLLNLGLEPSHDLYFSLT